MTASQLFARRTSLREIFTPGSIIRRILLAWILTCTVRYFFLDQEARALTALTGLSTLTLGLTVAMTLLFTAVFCGLGIFSIADTAERYALFLSFALYTYLSVTSSYTVWFFLLCAGVLLILGVYAFCPLQATVPAAKAEDIPDVEKPMRYAGVIIACLFTVIFTVLVCMMSVYRLRLHYCPTYDYGIFSQMFYYMKETGIPNTTCERDGLLSHFDVHVSPIYYVILPFYILFPSPVTPLIMQALILASGAVPLYLLARRHLLSPLTAAALAGILLAYPAYAGGVSYDLHENKFLTPLLLWLFYFIEKRQIPGIAVFTVLTLCVKEDAPVYAAVFALYLVLRALLRERAPGEKRLRQFDLITGAGIFLFAIVWFVLVTGYLARSGDGVMTYRYSNFMFDGSESLTTVIKAVILMPVKALFECADAEKMEFILQTSLPLMFLPFITRKYERFTLLIPYLLINLMSDYTYQHSIWFQYTYGATAFLLYAVILNLEDLTPRVRRVLIVAALIVGVTLFGATVLPKIEGYRDTYETFGAGHADVDEVLDGIPEDASVTASTFYTVPLSERRILYDLNYATEAHIFESEYIIYNPTDSYSVIRFADDEKKTNGAANLRQKIESLGYTLEEEIPNRLLIFRRPKA